jgi:hypothetical protein
MGLKGDEMVNWNGLWLMETSSGGYFTNTGINLRIL